MEREKCPNCKYWVEWYLYDEPLAMNRLYVKHKGSWLAVGWICPNCGHTKIDDGVIPFKRYTTVQSSEPMKFKITK